MVPIFGFAVTFLPNFHTLAWRSDEMKIFENIINHKINTITADRTIKICRPISNFHFQTTCSPNCGISKREKCQYI